MLSIAQLETFAVSQADRADLRAGPGVQEAERALVFQNFRRRERQTARGDGLGLSMVQQIVHAHRGTIEIGATAEGGARFEVRLGSP